MAKVTSTSFEVFLTAEEMFVIEQALDLVHNECRDDGSDLDPIAEIFREEFVS